jgi:hypothetical protein
MRSKNTGNNYFILLFSSSLRQYYWIFLLHKTKLFDRFTSYIFAISQIPINLNETQWYIKNIVYRHIHVKYYIFRSDLSTNVYTYKYDIMCVGVVVDVSVHVCICTGVRDCVKNRIRDHLQPR